MKKGFTFVELAVVFCIILLLGGLLLPAMKRAQNSAREKNTGESQKWYVVVEKEGKEVAAWASRRPPFIQNGDVTGYNDNRDEIFRGTRVTVVSRTIMEKEIPALMKKHKEVWIYPKQLALEKPDSKKDWTHDPWKKDK